MPRFKEPEEGVAVWRKVDIARVGIDSRSCFTNTIFSRLLVAYCRSSGRLNSINTRGISGKLSMVELREVWGCIHGKREKEAQCQSGWLCRLWKHAAIGKRVCLQYKEGEQRKTSEAIGSKSYVYLGYTFRKGRRDSERTPSSMTAPKRASFIVETIELEYEVGAIENCECAFLVRGQIV